ncbi:hypothetical protein P174DRAFT_165602 [Aspergillus novofumigatus IBT 16806]|uniref:Uncharacterized protein n=1 Tax=Aspergillus novofumigatus (strain IBT 16806) TaxID=1392255 RepID=A0A2I1C8H6_ASPN1|nr:uncharacterized protein P174DRAFT_165602 [Aspergillus novofumigatus IBT 16806]PKX93954.1 hypothetical protein P174DRAFT_165602 [Aspergillus novofumigatus IBT 16806]
MLLAFPLTEWWVKIMKESKNSKLQPSSTMCRLHHFRQGHQNVKKYNKKTGQKHTTAGIRWWSPTQLLTGRRVA